MIEKTIKELIAYAKIHLGLLDSDERYFTNYLMYRLDVKLPQDVEIDIEHIKEMTRPDELVKDLEEYLTLKGLDDKAKEKFITELFGMLTPLPSRFNDIFWNLYQKDKVKATDYFFDLSIKNNYVQKSKIEQNIIIESNRGDHDLVVTINLSKPEKSNKDIKAALSAAKTQETYPKCAICIENEGCGGSEKTPPRQNLRLIPLKLDNRDWYMQYSPYGYYNEHCIVILDKHTPMIVSKDNVQALFDFIDYFPHYFLGANSDLPIVGGSILTHEHFQGGNYTLPLMKASIKKELGTVNGIKHSILNWPSFALYLEGKDSLALAERIDDILSVWRKYNDESVDIIANDGEQHNTITTIAKKAKDGYGVYIIPRNNRCNDKYPGGIFHVHPERQIIKNEGIGLIEAMGLFILPPRLLRQLKSVEEIVKEPHRREEIYAASPDIKDFELYINALINKEYKDVNDVLSSVCDTILKDISVFKDDEAGLKAQERFLKEINL